MAQTPFLNITPVAAGQNNKEITINDADLALERATNDILAVSFAAGNVDLTAAQFTRHMVFRCTGLVANSILKIPTNVGGGANSAKRVFSVINDSQNDFNLLVTLGSGETVTIKKDIRVLLSSDGSNIRLLTTAGGTAGISIAAYIPGEQPPSSAMLRYTSITDFTLPAGLEGSFGSCVIYPDGGSVAFELRLNNIPFGSMEFADGSTDATFSLASPRIVAPGDVISVISPSETYDMSDLSFTLLGV